MTAQDDTTREPAEKARETGLMRWFGVAPDDASLPLLVAGTFFMQTLDSSVITPAIPAMAQSFGVRPVDMNLGVSIYMMVLGVFIPASGWAAARFGARRIFLASILIFTLASVLCGLSQSLPQFVAARALQGLGGAMMVPVGRLVVLQVTPKEQLMGVMALLTWPGLIGPVLGPPVGGLVVDFASWHWIFWLNLPLGGVALVAALRLLPHIPPDRGKPFDWLGFSILAPAIFCLLFAAESLGRAAPSWLLLAGLACVGLGLLGLGLRHLKRSRHPILRFDALRFRTFAVCVRGGSWFRMGINATPFLLPLLFQLAFGWSAFRAGLMITAIFAGNIAMKPVTTPILRRFGFRRVLIVTGVLNAVAVAGLALIGPGIPLELLVFLLFVSGLVRSLQFTALSTIAFADVPREEMSEANTLFSTLVQLSRGLGIALGAICWRLGSALFPDSDVAGFHFAFLVVAAVMLLSLVDCLRLPPDAGEVVRNGGRRRAA